MLIVGIFANASVRVAVTLDIQRLSPKLPTAAMKTENVFGKGTLDTSGNTIRVEVPRKSLRVIELHHSQ